MEGKAEWCKNVVGRGMKSNDTFLLHEFLPVDNVVKIPFESLWNCAGLHVMECFGGSMQRYERMSGKVEKESFFPATTCTCV